MSARSVLASGDELRSPAVSTSDETVALRKEVERAVRDLVGFADELDLVAERSGEVAAELLARRARSIADHLSDTLREEALDREAVGILTRLGRHWIARAVAEGVVATLAAKYGTPALVDAANVVFHGLGSIADGVGGLVSQTPPVAPGARTGIPAPTVVDATPATIELTAEPGVVHTSGEAAVTMPDANVRDYLTTDEGQVLTLGEVEPHTVLSLTDDERRQVAEEWMADEENSLEYAEGQIDHDDLND